MMYNEIGAAVLGCLSATFFGYGIRELTLAYKTPTLKAWSEQAVSGTAVCWSAPCSP